MPSIASAGRVAVLLFSGVTLALSQSTLPATAPTSTPAPAPNPISNATIAPQAAHRAVVFYAGGQLTVLAENSSLDQILRDVADQTGMTITGVVADDRVYGKYGPSSPSKVLSKLLEGTGTNIVLRGTELGAPTQLILTPRQGGPPPSPVASAPPAPSDPPFAQPPNVDSAAPPTQRGFTQQPPMPDGTADSASGPPGAGLENTAAGAETPQQVYQRLLQLQRSQAQQPANSQ